MGAATSSVGLTWLLARLDVPVDVSADDARARAARELLDPAYAQARPPLWQRVITWVLERVGDLLGRIVSGVAGGWWLVVLAALLALLVVVVLRRTGGVRRVAREHAVVLPVSGTSSDDHRAAAAAAAASDDFATAVLEAFRALVRGLEERGMLDERPGRTADEAAADVSGAAPHLTAELGRAARTFDDVAYGGRRGARDGYQAISRLDEQLRQVGLARAGTASRPRQQATPR